MINSKAWCGTKSHITVWAKVAGSLRFSFLGAHFAPSFHSSSFLSHGKILREVSFHISCNHRLIGRPATFTSGGEVANQFLDQTYAKTFQVACSVMRRLLLQNKAIENSSVQNVK